MDVTLVEQHVWEVSGHHRSSVKRKRLATGDWRRRLVKSADVVTRGRVESLVFSSGLLRFSCKTDVNLGQVGG